MMPAPLYLRSPGAEPLELVADAGGVSIRRGAEARRMSWPAVKALRYEEVLQRLTLEDEGGELHIPLDLVGEDGDFDDLLRLVLERVEPAPRGSLPRTFGAWRWGRIALWLALALAGVAAALIVAAQRAHWIVGAALAALWLTTVRYGGLGVERRALVTAEGYAVQRLWSSRGGRYEQLRSLRVLRVGRGRGRQGLELELSGRAGVERLSTLGAETLEAFFAIRDAARADDQA